jgi:methionine-rich copper-binding protein CopC
MRSTLFMATVSLISLISAGQAFAHAHLATATPQPNGTVQSAPSQVSIEYTEELEPKLSAIKVEDASGTEVDAGNSQVDAKDTKHMIVGLKPLQPGTYKVIWNATATDTHKTSGTYTFKVAG